MTVNTRIDRLGVYPVRADAESTTTLNIDVDTVRMNGSSVVLGQNNFATNTNRVVALKGGGINMLSCGNTGSLPVISNANIGTEIKVVLDPDAEAGDFPALLFSGSNEINLTGAWTNFYSITGKSLMLITFVAVSGSGGYWWSATENNFI